MKKRKQTGASFAKASIPALENNAASTHKTGNSTVSKASPSGSSSQQSMQKISKSG